MSPRAFLIAAIVTLQAAFVAVPALADYVWDDKVTMRIENDGGVSVVDLRTHYGMSDDRPTVTQWGLVGPGADFGAGTYAELEVGEVDANGDLVPYRQTESFTSLEPGDYAIVEGEGETRVALRFWNPNDSEATYRVSYHLADAVRRWADAGEARLRLRNPEQDQSERASFELVFPNDKDGVPAGSPTALQTWDHTVMEWEDEDEVYPIAADGAHGSYAAQGSAYLVHGIDHEVRALFPTSLLYEMEPLPQSQGEKVRAQEEAEAEAYRKKNEEEIEQRALEREAEELAHDQRASVEVPLFLASSIGMGAFCIYKARRTRRTYSQNHLQHVANSWYWHMPSKYLKRRKRIWRKRGEPKTEGVGTAMLSDDVHPLVLGWALTGGHLAYTAIAATLARLSTLGVVEIASVYYEKPKWDSEKYLMGPVNFDDIRDEWMLVFHKERFELVDDPLDREVLDMFGSFADMVSSSKSVTSRRSLVATSQGDCFLISDMRRMTAWYGAAYLNPLKMLLAAVRTACHVQGLDDDPATVDQRKRLKRLTILYTCVFALGSIVVFCEQPVVAVFASPIIAIAVFPYLLDSYQRISPLSQKAVQLRSELGRLRLWLHNPDGDCDEANDGLDTQAWQQVLARALVLGEDDKAADRLRGRASTIAQNADVRAMLVWCDKPAWGVVWGFEDAARHAIWTREEDPPPRPYL